MPEQPHPRHPEPDAVDKGLADAFADAPAARPTQSVLRALESRTGTSLGVYLDSTGPEDGPVKVTDETKQLRDPSGRYQVLGEIGRGAVGVVYKGRDVDLGRDVAMKILKDEYAERPDILARFVEEAQIGGQLQHPGIVPVYELGLQHGESPYFAMKLVKGETLAAQLARRGSPTEDRRRLLGIFEQVCQTIAYAHARRVVHRDLKPANVMIGAFGEVQVVDWGFAKVLPKGGIADEKESVARTSQRSVIETVRSAPGSGTQSVAGSLFGTPAYMPPEQALGDIDRLDQRSDVFGLGAILCEILTGVPPYLQEDGDLVRQAAAGVLEGAYQRLRNCGADDTLVELCIECLSRARRARPESAAQLAERISHYLSSVEERARQAEVRAARAHYRQRTTLMSAAAGLLVLALGAGTWIWRENVAQERRAEATQRAATAVAAANGALGRAQKGSLDPALWDAALASARNAHSLADSEAVAQDTRREAERLMVQVKKERTTARTEFDRRARDERMHERLQNLRIPIDDNVGAPEWFRRERKRLNAAYGDAFAEYLGDTSLFELSNKEVLASLRRGDIQVELATSLDHWGLVRQWMAEAGEPVDPAATARIREIAAQLDPDNRWRSELRSLLPEVDDKAARLRDLAERVDFGSLTPSGCRVLSGALASVGETDMAITVLQRGQELHPQDFDLCFWLAVRFEFLRAPRWKDAVQTYRIANALKPDHREVLHRQGMALQALGRHEDAERIFRRLDTREPNNAHWLCHIADILVEQGKVEQALPIYMRSVELDSDSSPTHNQLGRALDHLGRAAEAVPHYEQAVQLDEKNANAWSNLGNSRTRQGRIKDAITCHKRALAIVPTDPRYLNNMGLALARQGKWKEAIQHYEKALQAEPTHSLALGNLAAALCREGRFEEATARYHQALRIHPDDAMLHVGLAHTLEEQGELEKAIRSYRSAIAIDDKCAPAHNNLGDLLLGKGRIDAAIECFEAAIRADPGDVTAHFNLGVARQRSGDLQGAVGCYARAMQLDQHHESSYINLGAVLRTLGRTKVALAHCRNTVQKFPRSAQARVNYSNVLGDRGDRTGAIRELHEAVKLDPTLPQAHANLCNVLREEGDLDLAIAHGRKAVELDPHLHQGHAGLALALDQAGRIDEAMQEYRAALRLLPQDDWTWANLGSVYLRRDGPGDTEEAARCFRKAIDANPDNCKAHVSLGFALQKLEQVEEALAEYEAAVQIRPDLEPRFRGSIQGLKRRVAERPALLAVIHGKRRARDATEWANAVRVAYGLRLRAELVALTEVTLRQAPELIGDELWGVYNSACAAALLAADSKSERDAAGRARVYGLALAWLTREVEKWCGWVESGERKAESLRRLRHALKDPDFASVRGKALAALPETERAAWQELWTRIEHAAKEKEEKK